MSAADKLRFHVVVVLQEAGQWIHAALAATHAQTLTPRQVTLVDNLSCRRPGDPTPARLEAAFPGVRIMRDDRPLSFAACCNRAAAATREADYLLLLDATTVPSLVALERLAAAFNQMPSAAVMGCKVLGGDVETIQHLGSAMRGNGMIDHHGSGETDHGQYRGVLDVLSVQAAALAVRVEVWCELGGLDESFWPAHFEVADFCFRARAAHWRIGVACEATVTHFAEMPPAGLDARERRLFFMNRARFLRKHYRPTDWFRRFIPDELRWIAGGSSRGMRIEALTGTAAGLLRPQPAQPQMVYQADQHFKISK